MDKIFIWNRKCLIGTCASLPEGPVHSLQNIKYKAKTKQGGLQNNKKQAIVI